MQDGGTMGRAQILFVAFLALSAAAHAQDVKTGKLTDLRRYEDEHGIAAYCLSVEIDDLTYILDYKRWRWSYEPTDFIVGDPVQVRLKGKDGMYLTKPNGGGEFKAQVFRRERNTPGKPPATCALPVAVN